MSTTSTASGERVRDIEGGPAPTRFARGWHCLGPVAEFDDGQPHSIEAFGTEARRLEADADGSSTSSTATAGTWEAT
jgi:hypothetical protein